MTHFTVEVTTKPVSDFGWSPLRRILDIVPGTVLLEDADEPVLMIPVEAGEPMKAAMFVDGIAKLTGVEIVSGKIYPTPDIDFEVDDEDDEGGYTLHTAAAQVVEAWMEQVPALDARLTPDGRLTNA